MRVQRVTLALVCLAVLAIGCSEDRVLPTQVTAIAHADRESGCSIVTSGWIGPAGGSLALAGVRLQIPVGALESSTLIAIERRADGSVELSPDGQQFAAPVELSFMVAPGLDARAQEIQWFDPQSGVWVDIPSIASGATRTASLAHFSIYRITLFE